MESIELNLDKMLYEKISCLAKFLGLTIDEYINLIMQRELDTIIAEPQIILEVYLTVPSILELIFERKGG